MKRALVAAVIVLAACGGPVPAPECDTNPLFAGSALSCGDAVAAALKALPADHSTIERVQFLFGSATPCCSRLYREGEEQPVIGHVIITYLGGAERQYVPVVWFGGELSAGTPAEY
jgi:hypothetical protein